MPMSKAVLFCIIVLDGISFGLLIPIITPLLERAPGFLLSGSVPMNQHLVYAFVMALFPMGALIGSLLLGRLSDVFGRKKILSFGLAGTCLSYFLLSVSLVYQNMFLLLIGRFLSGFAALGNRPIAQAAMADLSAPMDRAHDLRLIALAMTIAMALGPLLGGMSSFVASESMWGMLSPLLLVGFLSVMNLVLLHRYFPTTHPQVIWGSEAPLPASQQKQQRQPEQAESIRVFDVSLQGRWRPWSWRAPFSPADPALRRWRLLISFFCLEAGWSLYFQSVPLYLLQTLHYGSWMLGVFLSYTGVWMCFGLTWVFQCCARVCAMRAMGLVSLLMATLAVGACGFFAHSEGLQWGLVIPLAIGVGLGYTALITLLSQITPGDRQGHIMGLTSALLALAWCCTGLLIAPLMAMGSVMPNVIACALLFFALLSLLSS